MTKPTLTHSQGLATTEFNSSSNNVTSETVNRDMQLFHFGIPGSNLSENVSHRTPFGVISITGEYTGTTESKLKDFIDEINAIAVALQRQSTYVSGINKSINVKINNFTYVTEMNTNKIIYTIDFYDETI